MEMFAMNIEDRLTFWKNWFDGIDQLPDEMWYDAIMRFAFKGEEPAAGNDLVSAIKFQAVQFVRATIGISRTRKENGAKGARKRQANAKQTASKREANGKQTRSKREANAMQEQVQVQEQEQEQYAISYTATTRQPPTLNQFVAAVKVAGIDEESARGIWQELDEAGWADKDGRPVANWRRYAKTTYNERKKNTAARENVQGSQDGRYVDLEGVE